MIATIITAATLALACWYDYKYLEVPHKIWIPALIAGLLTIGGRYIQHPVLLVTTGIFCAVLYWLGSREHIGGADAFALIILCIITPEPFTQGLLIAFTGLFVAATVAGAYSSGRFMKHRNPDVSRLPAMFSVAGAWICTLVPAVCNL